MRRQRRATKEATFLLWLFQGHAVKAAASYESASSVRQIPPEPLAGSVNDEVSASHQGALPDLSNQTK